MKYTIRNVIREDGVLGSLSLLNPPGRGYAEWVFTPYTSDDDHYEPYIEQGIDGLFRALTREQYRAKREREEREIKHERIGGGGIIVTPEPEEKQECECGHTRHWHYDDGGACMAGCGCSRFK